VIVKDTASITGKLLKTLIGKRRMTLLLKTHDELGYAMGQVLVVPCHNGKALAKK
jgi:hypothetical protein